jgi:hypothetical protein
MEESNIRWGEIIGGLLIIGCSTALVVSLWAQISQIPVLKFLNLHDRHGGPFRHRLVHRIPLETTDDQSWHSEDRDTARAVELSGDCRSVGQ